MQVKELQEICQDYELELVTWEKVEKGYKLLTDKGRVFLLLDELELIQVLEQTELMRPPWLPRPWWDCYGGFWNRTEAGTAYLLLDWVEQSPANWNDQECREEMTTMLACWHERVTGSGSGGYYRWKTPRRWWPDTEMTDPMRDYWQEMIKRNCPGIGDFRSRSWQRGAKRLFLIDYSQICCCIPPLELARWLELNGWLQGWNKESLLKIWQDYRAQRKLLPEEAELLRQALLTSRKIALGFAGEKLQAKWEEQRQLALSSLFEELGR